MLLAKTTQILPWHEKRKDTAKKLYVLYLIQGACQISVLHMPGAATQMLGAWQSIYRSVALLKCLVHIAATYNHKQMHLLLLCVLAQVSDLLRK